MMETWSRSEPMSAVDTAWFRMEQPTSLLTIAALLRFDDPLDFERVRSTIEHRLLRFDRFRQRPAEAKGRLGLPRWVFDPFFNLDAHLLRTRLRTGDDFELQRLLGDLMSMPLDPTRPLWQMHVVDNVQGGTVIIARIHHCIADGNALARVLLSLTDEQACSASVTTLPVEPPPPRTRGSTPLTSALHGVVTAGNLLFDRGRAVLFDPGQAMSAARKGASAARTLAKLAFQPPDPRTVLKGEVGTAKYAAWSPPLSLREIKTMGKAVGGTINDVLVCAVAGALRQTLSRRQDQVIGSSEIRAAMPVDLRKPHEIHQLGNRFGLLFLPLPINISEPAHRLWELKHRMAELKRSLEAGVALGVLHSIGTAGPAVEKAVMALFASKATLVLTNVAGPRETRYLAGRRVHDVVFWVPQPAGLGLGVSIFSYDGQVRVGVASDARLMPDPETFVGDFVREIDALRESVTPLLHIARERANAPPAGRPMAPSLDRGDGLSASPK